MRARWNSLLGPLGSGWLTRSVASADVDVATNVQASKTAVRVKKTDLHVRRAVCEVLTRRRSAIFMGETVLQSVINGIVVFLSFRSGCLDDTDISDTVY